MGRNGYGVDEVVSVGVAPLAYANLRIGTPTEPISLLR